MIIRKKNLLILLSISAYAFGAEQGTSEQDQKKALETVQLEGELRVLNDSISTVNKLFFSDEGETLKRIYNLDDNDILIRVDYCSQECRDWTSHSHPRLKNNYFRIDWLPIFKPIISVDRQSINNEINQTTSFPQGINRLIAEYAAGKSLFDCEHGDHIIIRLPIDSINVVARLQCTKRYSSPFHIALSQGLLNFFNYGLQLPEDVMQECNDRVNQYKKKEQSLAEKDGQ